MKDILNKKFGLLTVIEYYEPSKTCRGRHYWRCKCDCGNISVVRDSHLIYGSTKSCGCLHKRRGKDSPFFKGYGDIPLNYYTTVKRSALGGGISNRKKKIFDVSIEYLWKLFKKQNGKCALSDMNLSFGGTTKENKRKETNKFTASLDRIDSGVGYIKGNVQWVHKKINIMKNEFTQEEFINLCKNVAVNNP